MYNLLTTLNMRYLDIASISSTNKPILGFFDTITNLFYQENNKTVVENINEKRQTFKTSIKKSTSQKKQKNVKFSNNVKIYFIPSIDEFKESLPNTHLDFDNNEDHFIPLKHMEFVYELNNTTEYNEVNCKKETNNYNINTEKIHHLSRKKQNNQNLYYTTPVTTPITTPITRPTLANCSVCPQQVYINSLINKSFAEFEYKNETSFSKWGNITFTHPTIKALDQRIFERKNIPETHNMSDIVITEKPNSLPYFFNEFGFNNKIDLLQVSLPPPLFTHEIILQNEIPQMFKGLSCYRLL